MRRNLPSWLLRAALMVCLVLAGVGIGRFVPGGRAAAPPGKEALVAAAARQIGIRRCYPAISAIAQRATTGATMQDIMVDWDHQTPDAAPFFSLTGMGAGSERAVLSLTAIPGSASGCAAMVERISSTQRSCVSVAGNELSGFPSTRLIDGIMIYQNPKQPSETYTLVNSDGGCLVIRRQVAFTWPPRS